MDFRIVISTKFVQSYDKTLETLEDPKSNLPKDRSTASTTTIRYRQRGRSPTTSAAESTNYNITITLK